MKMIYVVEHYPALPGQKCPTCGVHYREHTHARWEEEDEKEAVATRGDSRHDSSDHSGDASSS